MLSTSAIDRIAESIMIKLQTKTVYAVTHGDRRIRRRPCDGYLLNIIGTGFIDRYADKLVNEYKR